MVVSDTPINMYEVRGRPVLVKREDLCCPGPAFSKLRGVERHIASIDERYIGVLDTYHSKAGWGVSMLCEAMGKTAVVFYPVYKDDTVIRPYQVEAAKHGARIHGLTAGRSCILYHRAKSILETLYNGSYMMPNALKCHESVDSTACEVACVPDHLKGRDTLWIVSCSSGTIAAGVMKGLVDHNSDSRLLLHMGYSRSGGELIRYMKGIAGITDTKGLRIDVVDEGYSYKDAVSMFAPFPCNPYYDRKAWKWLHDHVLTIPEPYILFWNIGA